MSSAAVDNDILHKGAWYGLLRELLSVIPAAPGETLVLKRFSMARDGRPFLSAARRVKRVVHVPSVLARSA